MAKDYSKSTSTPLGISYYKGMSIAQRRDDKNPVSENMNRDGFDLKDPTDLAFWFAAQQIRQENEKREKEKNKEHSSGQPSEYPLSSQS